MTGTSGTSTGTAPAGRGRRERLRAETTAEIKDTALRLMASGGPDAITLRAIAREMGMTANAIYGYFATRDDLVTTLIDDVYSALADSVEAAWAQAATRGPAEPPAGDPADAPAGDPATQRPAGDPATRILAWARAFRTWALANPEGFRLVYGDPVPGYRAPEEGPAPDAARRVCTGLAGLAAAAWPYAEPLYRDSAFTWDDFDAGLLDKVRPAFPDLPPAGVALALRLWGHLHGLVALEVYGHLGRQTTSPDKLFQEELTRLVTTLGVPRPAAG
ncbi:MULTISPECIES: TetR/AcrR family transcriptional regulator [unclassified Streptomyces]|uniref:TetR/AcrR family transcriptional regulator n=1 Tax=unclassified Streptomyces TaxID=2593676 RepID=UPI001656355D|nr:TetR/AcrR family transcriptional regulator [Streptomyces sp. CB02980]MCB8904465.1 TetR/AcrR family transcriptional regulator [Streptomyces sp. CB02980]